MTLQKLDLGVERELRAQTLPTSAAHEYRLCANFGPERMRICGGMERRLFLQSGEVMITHYACAEKARKNSKMEEKAAPKRGSSALMRRKHRQTMVLISAVDVQNLGQQAAHWL